MTLKYPSINKSEYSKKKYIDLAHGPLLFLFYIYSYLIIINSEKVIVSV